MEIYEHPDELAELVLEERILRNKRKAAEKEKWKAFLRRHRLKAILLLIAALLLIRLAS